MDNIKKAEILKFHEEFKSAGLISRRPHEKQWLINMAFLLGEQWLSWSNTQWMMYRPPAPTWRIRLVINKIFPNVLDILSKLASKLAEKKVIPSKIEDRSMETAKLCEKLLKHLDRENEALLENQKLTLWRIVYGLAYKDVGWDATRGQNITEPKTEEREVPNVETGLMENQTVLKLNAKTGEPEEYDFNLGEVITDIKNPFEVIWEPGVKRFRDSHRIMVLYRKTVESVKEQYPDHADEIKSEGAASMSAIESQLMRILGQHPQDGGSVPGQEGISGYCTVEEMRELPSKKYKKGRFWRVTGGTLLKHEESLPYKFMVKENNLGMMEYPYIDTGEKVPGETPVTQAIPLQLQINKTASQLVEIRNLMGKPKWVAYRESAIAKTAITSEPGEVIEPTYVPNVPEPHPVQMPSPGSYIPKMQDTMTVQLQDIFSIHEVTKGQTPPRIKSGVAIRALQEADERVYGPVYTSFEKREEIVAKWQLMLVAEKYREPRIIKIIGENNEVEVEEFVANADIPTDVFIVAASSFTQSRVAKQELIFSMFERGFFGDPADESVRQRILKLAEVGMIEMVYQEAMIDENESRREERLWTKGNVGMIASWDNHQVHIARHNMFRKSDKYRKLHPTIQKEIDAHINIHTTQLPETSMREQQEEMAEKQEVMMAEGVKATKQKADDDRAKTAHDMLISEQGLEKKEGEKKGKS